MAFGAARMLRDVVSSIPDGGWGWLWWCGGLDDLGHLGRIVGWPSVLRECCVTWCLPYRRGSGLALVVRGVG